jgi:hypothetical protein
VLHFGVSKTDPKTLSVYKTKPFARFAGKANIADADLWKAAWLANQGMIDADLGGEVIKQRIARRGQGKSGGSRLIVLLKRDNRAVFVYGFEKKDKSNIGHSDLLAFRALAEDLLHCPDSTIAHRVTSGSLIPVQPPQGGEDA